MPNITVHDFVAKYDGKAIDDDDAYGVQCVDGKRVADRELGIEPYITSNGWADGYWYGRADHTDEYDFITDPNAFQDGDEVIWAKGSASHPMSHVAIYYQGLQFGENQGGNGAFCYKTADFSDALGALRPKGDHAWGDCIPSEPAIKEDTPNAVYRLFNPNNSQHFLTESRTEANYLASLGMVYEGIAFYACDTGNPVHRLYNPNTGEHMYTVADQERDTMVNAGWSSEGEAFIVSSGQGTPVYRLYNAGQHLFTTDASEVASTIRAGWTLEGIGFYSK